MKHIHINGSFKLACLQTINFAIHEGKICKNIFDIFCVYWICICLISQIFKYIMRNLYYYFTITENRFFKINSYVSTLITSIIMLLHLLLILAICQAWLAFVDEWDGFWFFMNWPIIPCSRQYFILKFMLFSWGFSFHGLKKRRYILE